MLFRSQFSVGRITGKDDSAVIVEWDSPIWIRQDGSSRVMIAHLDSVPMRIMGVAEGMKAVNLP